MAQDSNSPFAGIKRADGTPMTQEDEDALMEFAHLFHLYQFFRGIINWDVSRGFGTYPAADPALLAESERRLKNAHSPIVRRDGATLSDDDEDALAPYGAFVVIGQMA